MKTHDYIKQLAHDAYKAGHYTTGFFEIWYEEYLKDHPLPGESKRLYLASQMAKGMLSNSKTVDQLSKDAHERGILFGEYLIDQAYKFADALIMRETL